MAGFPTADSVINAVTVNGSMQKLIFNKYQSNTFTALVWNTLWDAAGLPSAGANPTVGLAGAATCSSSTAGAVKFINAAGGAQMHLIGLTASHQSLTGPMNILVYDRLAHANISNDQATGSFSPVIDATARLGPTSGSGDGGMIMLEVTTGLSAGVNTRSFTYTNGTGTGSRTTQTVTMPASAAQWTSAIQPYLFVPLQAGDESKGVRSIEGTTLVSGTATGAFNVVVIKPLVFLNLPTRAVVNDRDLVIEMPMLPRIKDSACISFLVFPNTAAATDIFGELRICEN